MTVANRQEAHVGRALDGLDPSGLSADASSTKPAGEARGSRPSRSDRMEDQLE